MKVTVQKEDICEVYLNKGFEDVCREMEWELFTPTSANFLHEGWRISIEHEIAENVFAPMSKPWMRINPKRTNILRQRYTPSLRKFGKTCDLCTFRKNDTCTIGRFKVKMQGGCTNFKGKQ